MRSSVLSLVFILACLPGAVAQDHPPQFRDIARPAGLTVTHISSAEKRYIIESTSGGVGFIDCDNDGKLDILTANGSTVERYRKGGDPMLTLYHQDEDLKFSNITQQAGLTTKGWSMGISVADFDNDGLPDIFVTGYGGTALYRNKGGCKFEDVTSHAGVRVDGFSTGAAFADYDRDGNVDLFVARYVHADIDKLPEFGGNEKFCRYKGILVQCGPWGMPGETDFLFHNRGDGTFEDVSKKAGLDDPDKRFGLGAVWGDYDNDGWPDLYVANDAGPNFLYHNRHNGTFEDVALLGGAAVSADGQELGSMGVDFGDFDHDGRLDIMVANFTEQTNNLYRNLGDGQFSDLGWSSKMGKASYPLVGWGTGFVDFDNDGWADVFVADGHVYPQIAALANGPGYVQPMLLFRNARNNTFDDITAASGLGAMPLQSRRGAAFGDVNNDGDVDVLILNVGEQPSLLLSSNENGNHRVLFQLAGVKSNRLAIDARVTIKAGNTTQFNEVRSGGSYISQNDFRLHFGLGSENTIQSVEVRWPNGNIETLRNLAADAIYTVTEGKGVTATRKLPPPTRPPTPAKQVEP